MEFGLKNEDANCYVVSLEVPTWYGLEPETLHLSFPSLELISERSLPRFVVKG